MPTHYEVLGIPRGAPAEQVRHAYRRLVKATHPDRAGDPTQFQRVTHAYEVLSDPVRRAAYDRSLQPASVVPPARRRPRRGRYAAVLVAALLAGGAAWLVGATRNQSVGDGCLVGTWRGEAFEVPFRGFLDGREIEVPIRGGAGVRLAVAEDGTVRTDHAGAAPFAGARGTYRVEGTYAGTTREHWQAAGGRIRQGNTDASRLTFRATINGRPPDRPVAVTLVDREYPYTCTPQTLDLGPYRYVRA